MAGKRLNNCKECEQDHRPKGSGSCPYVRTAKLVAAGLGPAEDWRIHLDLNLMRRDSADYLGTDPGGSGGGGDTGVSGDHEEYDDSTEETDVGEASQEQGGPQKGPKKLSELEIEALMVDFMAEFKLSRQVMQQQVALLNSLVMSMPGMQQGVVTGTVPAGHSGVQSGVTVPAGGTTSQQAGSGSQHTAGVSQSVAGGVDSGMQLPGSVVVQRRGRSCD